MILTERSLKVLIAHSCPDTRETLKIAVRELGHELTAPCETAAELVTRGRSREADLIITGVELPDFDGVTALVEISRDAAIPSIIVTRRRSLALVERALDDHVMAYLMEPVQPHDVKPAVYLVLKRFEQFEELRNEVSVLKQTLEDRQLIERAKGVLMGHGDVSEEEAHKRLRRMATDCRIRMIEAARRILEPDEPPASLS